ncbi:hypothetical protein BDV96DRAFT_625796 [Lophiotrema nucula]|uniref:DUF6594 domain-containing protein n=1 Tax=Lophiotrema nucula TaxID=690887 RepID=A0A6A5YHK4_9PLEO|nr:hypothetical protein BDV96DRAFT_625796 [Lophiotrema nucula]
MAQQSYQASATVTSAPPHHNSQPSSYATQTSPPIPLQAVVVATTNPAAQQLSEKEKKQKAWKYEGYREFSKWMASDDDCFVIRRFHSLNAHVILYLQDRIVEIEEELEKIHVKNASNHDDGQRNSSFRWDRLFEPERDRLMKELADLLHQYNQHIDTYSRIRERPQAERRQVQNLQTYMRRGAITKAEGGFAQRSRDLMSINPKTVSPLGRLLESTRVVRLSRFFQAKADPDSHIISDYVHYTSDEALAIFTTIAIIVLGLVMLLGPLWWLEFVANSKIRLGIITGFLAVFMGLMSLATNNRPFEVVASSAAYAAVLMVYMQIGSNG